MSRPTFLGVREASQGPEPPAAVILGMPLVTVYRGREPHAVDGPSAIRRASQAWSGFVGHHDFDTGGPFADWWERVADAGDVAAERDDAAGNRARLEGEVRRWLATGSLPVVLGGDDSVPIPVLAAYRDRGPVSVLHIDAHLDYRDEVDGERYGYSSPMRRVGEMPWVRRIHHVGQRGVGSARPADVEDTVVAGGRITTANALRDGGVQEVVDSFAPGEAVVIVLDVDAIDPAELPAVRAPSPGGPSFVTVMELIGGVVRRADCRGFVVTELEPTLDVNGLSSRMVCRILCHLLDEALSVGPGATESA